MPEEFTPLDRDRIAAAGDFWRVSVFRETASTNDLVMRAGEGGEAEGRVIFAETQTRGRGQFGRRWDSAPGLGLWFSLLLRPRWPAAEIAQMTPLVAVAVARALGESAGLAFSIKPPNDIFFGGRKVAGILSEARTGRDVFVAVGIGINVNHARTDFPLELQTSATSLARIVKGIWDRNELAVAVLRKVAEAYDPRCPPGSAVLEEYAALSRAGDCASFRP